MSLEYKKIVDNLSTERVINLMKELGIDRYKETDTALIFPTICHNESAPDSSLKLYFYKDTHLFYCYTECGAQSIFTLLRNYYETRGMDYNWFGDIYERARGCADLFFSEGFEPTPPVRLRERYKRKTRDVKLEVYNKGLLEVFHKHYPIEWLQDGISKEAMDKFGIRYSISQNKIIIPHYNVQNELVGIRGRALNEDDLIYGKYMPVQIEGFWYSHKLSLNLYGLNVNLENIKKNKVVYLFEGEKSVLQFESFKRDNCAVAVCGNNFNKYQLNLLLKNCYPKEIIVCFDKEEKPGSDEYFNKLYQLGKKYSNYCNFSFIYDRENLLEQQDSPSDKGEEVFEKLLEKRVIVR